MTFRSLMFLLSGCAALVGVLYGLWYLFGPETAEPDMATMRAYRLSRLTDAELNADIAQAKELYAKGKAAERERAEASRKEYDERYRAWKIASAPCKTNQAFKFRNEELCDGPPSHDHGVGFITGPVVPEESEADFIEHFIMMPCEFSMTVREARRNGCLPPK